MLGSAVTGGLSMAMEVTVRAPHGGIFVLFAVEACWATSSPSRPASLVGAVAVIVLKCIGPSDADVATV